MAVYLTVNLTLELCNIYQHYNTLRFNLRTIIFKLYVVSMLPEHLALACYAS